MKSRQLPFDLPMIQRIAQQYATPFYLYDESGIRGRIRELQRAFSWCDGFREYFAVKATPNPHIVNLLREEGAGTDCSSPAELVISERIGLRGEEIVFTSNNTTEEEFRQAHRLGAIINLDDLSHIDKLIAALGMPEIISFRFNPGAARVGNSIIGNPVEAKFGCTRDQLFEGYERCRQAGARRFGLHTMVVSNELKLESFFDTARMLFELAGELRDKLDLRLEYINLGGGIGIPYKPEDTPLDLPALGNGIRELYESMIVRPGLAPIKICMENGRAMTGPFGFLVTRAINFKQTHKDYIGVDACMSNLMRPGMYGAYHHITVLGKEGAAPAGTVDVVGALCENNDKFAIDRPLPSIEAGDFLVVHDAGAHGHSMGFQYNGRLRSAELLLRPDGSVKQIRRAETLDDYFATVDFSELGR